jgi:hypothetical protein
MHYDLSPPLLSHFTHYGFIEIEEAITDAELAHLYKAIQLVDSSSFEKKFLVGRDLFRKNAEAKKVLFSRKLCTIASKLSNQRVLQAGYDQLFFGTQDPKVLKLIPEKASINDLSSMSQIACAMLVSIDVHEPPKEPEEPTDKSAKTREEILEEEAKKIPILSFPKEPKNALFLSPRRLLPLKRWVSEMEGSFMLVVWVYPGARYKESKLDPHSYALKHEDYAYGDVLLPRTHPYVKK